MEATTEGNSDTYAACGSISLITVFAAWRRREKNHDFLLLIIS
jgi:hypothetical protein